MKTNDFNSKKLIHYWTDSSDEDYDTMMAMYHANRYSWSLFAGHLMIEKLLKAYFVKVNNDYPPYTHNLLRIAESAGLALDETQKTFFATVTAFNINAYMMIIKKAFKKNARPNLL